MARTTDALIVYGDDETAVYLPGSRAKLETGQSVLTPDDRVGIVQAIYPESGVATVAVPALPGEPCATTRRKSGAASGFTSRQYPFNRLHNA